LQASDIMTREVIFIAPETPVHEIAQTMLDRNIGALPVLRPNGSLAGLVTKADLIVQEAQPRFPRYLKFLDSVIFLESTREYEEELRKELATTAADLMTAPAISVPPSADVSRVANLMVEKHLSAIPVIAAGQLVGIVTRTDLVRLLAQQTADTE
jgi:CBS domain-containing protein